MTGLAEYKDRLSVWISHYSKMKLFPSQAYKRFITRSSLESLRIRFYCNNIKYYKDRKCAVNENPSVRIESARSKTSNNGPLKNGSAVSIARLYVGSKIVCFYESDHAFKTIWRHPCFRFTSEK